MAGNSAKGMFLNLLKYLLDFTDFLVGVVLPCRYCRQRLPSVVFNAVNVLLSRWRQGNFIKVTHSRNNNLVVNPIERRVTHYSVFAHQPSFSCFQIGFMPFCNLIWDFAHAEFGEGVKYPFLNCVPGNERNRFTEPTSLELQSEFTDQLAGINYLRGQLQGIGVNILNDHIERRTSREPQNSPIYLNRGAIKTIAYRAVT